MNKPEIRVYINQKMRIEEIKKIIFEIEKEYGKSHTLFFEITI